jgi:hypothetical protein
MMDTFAADPLGPPDDLAALARRVTPGLVTAVIPARATDPATARNVVAACLPPSKAQEILQIKGAT